MRSFKFVLGALAIATAALVAPLTNAQGAVFLGEPVDASAGSITADDTSIAAVIRYIGTGQSGKVVVAAGTITLTSGVAAAEVADTTIECPLSAPFAGVLDLTNAACDTVGELADVVNSTAGSKWRIVPVASLRTDVVNARLLANAGATGNGNAPGLKLFWDTSTAFDSTLVAGVGASLDAGQLYSDVFDNGGQAKANPYFGQQLQLLGAQATSTFGSGTSNLQVYSVKTVFSPSSNKYTEVVTKVYEVAGGATTVQKDFSFNSGTGLFSFKDEKVLVRLRNSAAQSVVTLLFNGLLYRRR